MISTQRSTIRRLRASASNALRVTLDVFDDVEEPGLC